jgi:hypothetical protein
MRPAAAGGGSAMKESEADVSVWSSMFEEDEGAYVDVDVARATVDPDRDRQRQREDESGGSPHLPQLRVSDYGAEEFWHQRWDANAAAGYEWYTVSYALSCGFASPCRRGRRHVRWSWAAGCPASASTSQAPTV